MPNQRPGYEKPAVKKKQSHPESEMQQACVIWFRYQYAPLKKLLWANGNGGQRQKAEARIMKGEGVQPGVPDLTLAVPRGDWCGLYIELKVLPNQPTDEQKTMMELLTSQGYYCQVIYTKEQFMSLINNYLSLPKRGHQSQT